MTGITLPEKAWHYPPPYQQTTDLVHLYIDPQGSEQPHHQHNQQQWTQRTISFPGYPVGHHPEEGERARRENVLYQHRFPGRHTHGGRLRRARAHGPHLALRPHQDGRFQCQRRHAYRRGSGQWRLGTRVHVLFVTGREVYVELI